jgi:hypothetical protein
MKLLLRILGIDRHAKVFDSPFRIGSVWVFLNRSNQHWLALPVLVKVAELPNIWSSFPLPNP